MDPTTDYKGRLIDEEVEFDTNKNTYFPVFSNDAQDIPFSKVQNDSRFFSSPTNFSFSAFLLLWHKFLYKFFNYIFIKSHVLWFFDLASLNHVKLTLNVERRRLLSLHSIKYLFEQQRLVAYELIAHKSYSVCWFLMQHMGYAVKRIFFARPTKYFAKYFSYNNFHRPLFLSAFIVSQIVFARILNMPLYRYYISDFNLNFYTDITLILLGKGLNFLQSVFSKNYIWGFVTVLKITVLTRILPLCAFFWTRLFRLAFFFLFLAL